MASETVSNRPRDHARAARAAISSRRRRRSRRRDRSSRWAIAPIVAPAPIEPRPDRDRFYTQGMDGNMDSNDSAVEAAPRLDPVEIRVLGTLVEKAHTVASQYPMTLNAIVAGANQRSNRDPVEQHDEEGVLDALDRLRGKGFVHEVNLAGSRVPKYRHVARERLGVATGELVVLTELMLRGPQTVGELRGRASRMHPLESTEVVANLLDAMRGRPHPLVERLPPVPGTRAERYRHLLGPIDDASTTPPPAAASRVATVATASRPADDLLDRVASLERRISALESAVGSALGSAPESGFGSSHPDA